MRYVFYAIALASANVIRSVISPPEHNSYKSFGGVFDIDVVSKAVWIAKFNYSSRSVLLNDARD